MRPDSGTLLLVCDLLGTFVFAIEGGSAAAAGRLDALGVLVLSFATALGGGVIRDLLIGAAPPNAIRDWRYAATALFGGAVVLFWSAFVARTPRTALMLVDAAGLSLFAVAGANKALAYRVPPLSAILLGAVTGAGGGVIRDILLARVPAVLQTDIYAVAAIFGAALMMGVRRLRVPPGAAALVGGVGCFALRVVSVYRHWNLPTVR